LASWVSKDYLMILFTADNEIDYVCRTKNLLELTTTESQNPVRGLFLLQL
jgi:hypothetical protein